MSITSSELTILKHENASPSSEPQKSTQQKGFSEFGVVHEIHNASHSADIVATSNGNSNSNSNDQQQMNQQQQQQQQNVGGNQQQSLHNSGVLDQPKSNSNLGCDGLASLDKANSKPEKATGEHSK